MKRKQWLYGMLLILLSISAHSVFADDGRVVRSGEVIANDIATRDNLIIEEGGEVHGSVTLVGSDAVISGKINGDLLVTGGDVTFADSAEIQGECFVIGGMITNLDAHEYLNCTIFGGNTNIDISRLTDTFPPSLLDSTLDTVSIDDDERRRPQRAGTAFRTLFYSLALSGMAFLIALIAPQHLERIGDAITVKPVASGTVGILTFISTVSLGTIVAAISGVLTLVCVGFLGIPLVVALGALLAAGIVAGWAAVGTLFGELLADRLNLGWTSLPLTTGVGTLMLSLLLSLIGWFSWGGFASVIGISIALIGLGATALTKFGSLPYPRVIVSPNKVDITIH